MSGQIGLMADGSLPDDHAGQHAQAWENVKGVLASAGMGVEHIVRVNGFITGTDQIAAYRTGARHGDGRLEAGLDAGDRGRPRRPRARGRDRGHRRRTRVSDLRRVAVLGAGTIGAVLARVLAEAGCDVRLWVRYAAAAAGAAASG